MKSARHLATSNFSIDSSDLSLQKKPQQNCVHQSLPNELGVGWSDIFQLDHNLSFIDTHYIPSTNLAILSKIDNQEPRLILTLGLEGHSRFSSHTGEEFYFDKGYATITSVNSSLGEREYQADTPIRQLRLSINKHWIDKYYDENKSARFFSKKETQLLSYLPISA